MSRTPSAPMIAVLAALASAWTPAPLAQTAAPPVVELPAPTGRYPVATTSWRLTDCTRPETFAGAGEFRQVEVVAWYPAASRGGTVAPYLREGLSEVRAFAKLFGSESAFDGLERVRTHAELDGAPARRPENSRSSFFPRLHRRSELLHRAARRSREPRIRRPQRGPSLRGHRRDVDRWTRGLDERPRWRLPPGDPDGLRRMGLRGRDDGGRHAPRRVRCCDSTSSAAGSTTRSW